MPGAAGCPCWSRPSHHHWPSKVGGLDTSARNSRPEGHAITAMDTRWPGSSNAQCTLGHPPCSTSIHIRSGLQWGTAAVLGLPGLPPSATGCHSPRAFRVQAHPSRCHHHGPTNVSLQATSRRGSNPDEGSLNRNCPPGISERTPILHRPARVGRQGPIVPIPHQVQALRRTTGCALIALQMQGHVLGLGSAHGRRGVRVHGRDDPTYRGIPLPMKGRDRAHCDAHPKCDCRV